MAILTYILGSIVIVATALPFLKSGAWWIRVFDFPRMQVTVIGVVAVLLFLGVVRRFTRWRIVFLVAVLTATVVQAVQIWPHTAFAAKQAITAVAPQRDNCVSLLISNVYQYNHHSEGLVRLVHDYDPDLMLAVETDTWWADQLAGLAETHPYHIERPQENTYGMVLYSRLPLVTVRVQNLVDSVIPSVYAQVQLKSGAVVDLFGLHPMPPHPIDNQNTIERDAELVVVSRIVQRNKRPTIVAGDLNDVAWSHTTRLFQRISGLLDPRVGRGLYNTFPTSIPFFRFPLDHVFHSAEFKLLKLERLPDIGSDHFPMYVSLCYQPAAKSLQSPPEKPDREDYEEAKETIKEAREKQAAPSDGHR